MSVIVIILFLPHLVFSLLLPFTWKIIKAIFYTITFLQKVNTAEDRAAASQWTHFANASLGPAIFMKEQRDAGVMDKLFAVLDGLLKEKPFLEGDDFSVSDVAVGSYLSYIPVFFPDIKLDAYPNLQAYVGKVTARPAFKSTVGAPPPAAS